MKKIFLQALLLLITIAVFAQDEEAPDKYEEFGRKNAIPIIIGVIVVIVGIILLVKNRKKKKNQPPQQTG